jgi:hypothetical protein
MTPKPSVIANATTVTANEASTLRAMVERGLVSCECGSNLSEKVSPHARAKRGNGLDSLEWRAGLPTEL